MLRPEDQYHVGVVVEDFDATREQLSSLFRVQWGDEMGQATQVELQTGAAVLDFRLAYSRTSPRLEIVQRIPGTFFEPTPGSGIHHLGYWSDDVAADTAELERHGYETEATSKGPGGAPFFAFLRSATGFRVELVTRTAQPDLGRSWAYQPEATDHPSYAELAAALAVGTTPRTAGPPAPSHASRDEGARS